MRAALLILRHSIRVIEWRTAIVVIVWDPLFLGRAM